MDRTQRSQAILPFKTGWWAADLGEYRPCDGTYCFYPYETLPPLPPLDGSLAWLGALPEDVDRQMEPHRNAPDARGPLAHIREEADRLGLVLPGAFLRLMGSTELQDRIPSCTACYFQLSDHIAPCPDSENGYIVRFLNDQQDVLAWYLYLTPAGEHCVLVSPYELDSAGDVTRSAAEQEHRTQAIIANTSVCAASFEEFIYRFWLENVLWFKLSDGSAKSSLTADERRYLTGASQHSGDQPSGAS
ncbi:MAG TPA: hypothetical protein VFN78_01110 [Ktedonobacterales bacterium]|nr:hypothetical protein [Ktedonobacterales bacterium]